MSWPDKPGNTIPPPATGDPKNPSPRARPAAKLRPGEDAVKGYVYILASRRHGTLYTGVTSHLSRRLFEHQHELTPGFTSRYGVKRLVWVEEHDLVVSAIQREKSIKKYPRQWKINLIEALNPKWDDISSWLFGVD